MYTTKLTTRYLNEELKQAFKNTKNIFQFLKSEGNFWVDVEEKEVVLKIKIHTQFSTLQKNFKIKVDKIEQERKEKNDPCPNCKKMKKDMDKMGENLEQLKQKQL